MIPMHGQINAQEIFHQLCGAIEDAGLSWKRFAGITTDGAPSMTGRKNGLWHLFKENWKGRMWRRPLLCTALSIRRPFAANV